ncbi:TPA: GntR family transcriptional regulator, partial [Escherichia coli]|nr:GntR family transcriptional regulator [Shigella flexneri]HAW0386380.1 GntR family transcriptional regulator [Escherichia coli]HAW0648720.1 GntR family transcriptional regulator [Escherichia coli]
MNSFCHAGRVGQKTREGIKMPGTGKMKHVSLTLQ